RRPIGPFPRATATDRSTEPSRITAPVFLCTGLTRIRVFLKSPVLENGTPGSVRGRFGQLAVLPRWRTNQRSPVRCEESCQIGNSWHFWLLGDSSWVYLPGISLSDPARDLAESASRHHLRFRRPIKVVPTLNCLPSVIDGRRFVCVLVLGNVSNAPVYVPTMSDLYINDVSGPVLPPWGEWLLEMGRANKPYVE